MSFLNRLGLLARNAEYVMLLATITIIFYIVAGIQYWTTNYLITVL